MNKNQNMNGYTLIELLISIGVLGLVSGVIISSFLSLSAAYDKADVVVKVNHEGSRIMEQLSRLIRSSHEATLSGSNLILTIPADNSNLEYKANGNCTQEEIYWSNGSNPWSINKRSSSCASPAVCSVSTPCVLTSTDVHVENLVFNVTEYPNQPDIVSITFELQQNQSLSDPQQQSSMTFERVVSTRGYR